MEGGGCGMGFCVFIGFYYWKSFKYSSGSLDWYGVHFLIVSLGRSFAHAETSIGRHRSHTQFIHYPKSSCFTRYGHAFIHHSHPKASTELSRSRPTPAP